MSIKGKKEFGLRNNQVFKSIVAGVLLTGMMSVAQAAMVDFTDISATDGSDAAGFDVSATMQTGDTTLTLGVLPFNISASGGTALASDTLLVNVAAPAGFKITSLTYSESGEWVAPNGFAAATIQMLVNQEGQAPGGTAGFNTSGAWGPLGQNVAVAGTVTEAAVSISNQLFAGGDADIWKTGGTLEVGLAAIPLPPAIWLMGAAIAALVSVGRRQAA